MRLVLARPAARDLEDIVAFVARGDPDGAERLSTAIADAARGLAADPASGRPGRIHETRELPVGATPYTLIYRADGGEVTILAVFHGARDVAQAFRERGE